MILLVATLAACGGSGDTADSAVSADPREFTNAEIARLRKHWPLGPVPADPTNRVADDPAAQRLGHFLFFDPRLSSNGEISCATCHDPEFGWGDGLPVSEGLSTTGRHAPTIWNAGYTRWSFWDGRCDSLWCQATGPIEAAGEMGGDRLAVAHLIAEDAELAEAYEEIFGPLPDISDRADFPDHAMPGSDPLDPITEAWESMTSDNQAIANEIFVNVAKSIAAYERLIVSRDSSFDEFAETMLTGEGDGLHAMSDEAVRGLKLFLGKAQCHFCHDGPNFTNQEFGAEKLDFLALNPEMEGQFKVPTLRNIATNAPYMHGGHFETLDEVMNHYVNPSEIPEFGHREDLLLKPWATVMDLTEQEMSDVVSFLEALTSPDIDANLTVQPASPILE